jgi:RNA polymerase sigma-70 factor (ECF subfamily)
MVQEKRPQEHGAESDEDLAAAAAAGSRAAFERLVERWGGPVLAALERRVGDAHLALDLVQEVWVRVFRGLAGFRPRGASTFRSWLFGIALNAVRDEGRRQERARIVYIDEVREAAGAADPNRESEERAAVEAALLRVEEPYRTALVLVDLLGFSYDEAARSEACAVGTIKSRIHRGRLAFRDAWAPLDADLEVPAGGSS